MPTSSRRPSAGTFAEQALALAWGAWAELGVSGWSSTHSDWAIDPEPLIIFTATLGDADPRLRDEVTDWCVRNWRHVSKTRLKNLLREQPDDVQLSFGELAATVGAHAGTIWPGATQPRPFTVTGRSKQPALDRPSAAWLRIRAIFGVSARAEILRAFLSTSSGPLSIASLASATGYTKRNVTDECDLLERAGILAMRARGNRFYYSLARGAELGAFVGELPSIRPDWSALLNVTRELVSLELRAQNVSLKTLPVHVTKTLRLIADELDELSIDALPENVPAGELWPSLRQLGDRVLGAWSTGRWPSPAISKAAVRRLQPANS
ncbi:MAG: winged helix-turn-helix domain-containing protein [Mycobacteriales bacterium]